MRHDQFGREEHCHNVALVQLNVHLLVSLARHCDYHSLDVGDGRCYSVEVHLREQRNKCRQSDSQDEVYKNHSDYSERSLDHLDKAGTETHSYSAYTDSDLVHRDKAGVAYTCQTLLDLGDAGGLRSIDNLHLLYSCDRTVVGWTVDGPDRHSSDCRRNDDCLEEEDHWVELVPASYSELAHVHTRNHSRAYHHLVLFLGMGDVGNSSWDLLFRGRWGRSSAQTLRSCNHPPCCEEVGGDGHFPRESLAC